MSESCLLRRSEITPALHDKNLAIIDTRLKKSFNAFHIPGSLSLRASSIKDQVFLKDRALMLLGEPLDSSVLSACYSLRQEGFHILGALPFGINSLTAMGGNSLSEKSQELAFHTLPLHTFLTASKEINLLYIFQFPLSSLQRKQLTQAYSIGHLIQIESLPQESPSLVILQAIIRKFLTENESNGTVGAVALVLEEASEMYQRWESVALAHENVFFVKQSRGELLKKLAILSSHRNRKEPKLDKNRCD